MARISMLVIALFALFASARWVYLAFQPHPEFRFAVICAASAFICAAIGASILKRLADSAA